MSKVIHLKKGLNIRMKGKPNQKLAEASPTETYAINPPDFPGVVPKVVSKEGAEVKTGTVLFYDKNNPEIKFTSPTTGRVKAINRGERRRILEVVVEATGKEEFETFKQADPVTLKAEEIKELLLNSGMWPMLRRRPYNIVAKPNEAPAAIFISGFNTLPLGPDIDFLLKDQQENFQTGINALKKLTEGKIHLNLYDGKQHTAALTAAEGVEFNYFKGPHPAGEPGIQIHHISPINKGDIYWHIHPQDVAAIGRFFKEGRFIPERIVALSGSEVKEPQYYHTRIGAEISPMVKDNVLKDNVRYISGSVLYGTKIRPDGYIGYYHHHVAVIPEGNDRELFGWAKPGFDKFSLSRTFFSWLQPKREFVINTNLKGGRRSYVVTGEYEQVLPMDILPQQLIKSILIEDIDRMEQLGIYEIAEEDVALMEFVCTSKQPVQKLVREGIDLMIRELG